MIPASCNERPCCVIKNEGTSSLRDGNQIRDHEYSSLLDRLPAPSSTHSYSKSGRANLFGMSLISLLDLVLFCGVPEADKQLPMQ